MRSELIRDPGKLAELEPAWWALFGRIGSATPFSSPAWLLPWWEVFAPGNLMSVAVFDEDRLVGLAPLYRESRADGGRLLPIGTGVSDFTDILVDPAHEDEAAAAILATLDAHAADWTSWSAEEAPPDATVLKVAVPRGWSDAVEPQIACPVLTLSSPFSAAASGIPSHKRRTWTLARNRTARRASHLRQTTPETLEQDLHTLFRLHAARWEGRGEAGVLAHEAVQRFHAAAAPALLAAGLLRLSTLSLDGEMAGAYYGMHRGARAFAYLTGFDPRFSFESPGTVVMGAAIEAAALEGATEFHFLRGQEGYKYGLGAVDRWNSRRVITGRR